MEIHKDKHSSLLQTYAYNGRQKFYNIGPGRTITFYSNYIIGEGFKLKFDGILKTL
jgi:hypothetical protein